jgi:hypothetical protein
MKSLKEYLMEAITADDPVNEETLKSYNLVYNDRTGRYDCDGDVKVKGDLYNPKTGTFKIKFGVVKGNFMCYGLSDLRLYSLEGAPEEVGGNFDCSDNRLTSLEGAPEKVGGNFQCASNNIKTLKGGPKEVGGGFGCAMNRLTSLEGAPEKVGGGFNCNYNKLVSLEGAPEEVGDGFCCWRNNLTSLEGAPKKVGGDFECYSNKLTTLEGAPEEVGGDFNCRYNSHLVYDEKNFYECLPKVIGGELIADDKKCDYELAKDYYDTK